MTRHEPGEDGAKKTFRQWTPDASKPTGWKAGLNGAPPLLYHLPTLMKHPGEPVFLPEGEKDCEYLESLGLLATTNSGGAKYWKPELTKFLRGRVVIICGHNDDAGRELTQKKAQSLAGIAAACRIIFAPPPHNDMAEWRPTKQQVLDAASAAPDWQAPPEIEIPAAVEKPTQLLRPDFPVECLQGRLGEICMRRLSRSPLAYSWPALLAAAAGRIDEHAPKVRTNLYVCLVGGVGTGKTQTIEAALEAMGIERPQLLDAFIGSGEALGRECAKAGGNPRVYYPDELGHTFQKMKIENAGFSFIFSRAFDRTEFYNLMGKKESAIFNCDLTVVGGVVEERFDDYFSYQTTIGVHDRFLFGLCPSNFEYLYRPFEGLPEVTSPCIVQIDSSIWDWRDAFMKEHPRTNKRLIQIVIRAAVICASYDGVRSLTVDRMAPHIVLLRDQTRVRTLLQPNPGENFEGQIAHKILNFLTANPGWQRQNDVYRAVHGTDKGPSVFARALQALISSGQIIRKIEKNKAATGRTYKRILLRLPEPGEEVEDDDA